MKRIRSGARPGANSLRRPAFATELIGRAYLIPALYTVSHL